MASTYSILLDTRFCTGCNTCFYKCVQENRLHDTAAEGHYRTLVLIKDDGLYHRRCMHCKEPSCEAVCPTAALSKTDYGPVLYDAERCIGCKTCVAACPFHVPQWDETRHQVVKCTMCAHRLQDVAGGKTIPACVEVCPTGALIFGEYDELVAMAKQIASENKLHIYGLEENGGTHLIILAKEKPEVIGYPAVPRDTVRSREIKSVSGVVAGAAAVAALAYAGIKKYSERRIQVQNFNRSEE
ncbi:MAG TPA: 4Fe-4S dicluster domain-containing protein [Syntrophomonadaceae bacterium]|nr:4Fe-4S dicluster domain-containing protein [Syntrophomonadaceae bacterium]